MCPKLPPLRTCTGCGQKKEKTKMVRVVADPSGRLIADLKGSMPSRGAYVCPDLSCIKKAATGRLAYSLKVGKDSGKTAAELQGTILAAYRQRVLSLLGQARKSGRVTSGTNLVEGELRRGSDEAWLGLMAGDASLNIAEKIEKALKAASVPYRIFSDKEGLGNAVGKSPRSIILVKDGGMARVIRESLDRCQNVLSNGGLDK
jgi:predicted RNA-binding protein YlxR (DUF448 family)